MEFTFVRGEEVNILLKSFSNCQRRERLSARCVFRPLPFLGNSHFRPPAACFHPQVDGDRCRKEHRACRIGLSPQSPSSPQLWGKELQTWQAVSEQVKGEGLEEVT